MTPEPPLQLLERALAQADEVIASVAPEQSSLPTPCSGWDVQALVRHMVVQDLRNFTVAARGETADWGAAPDDLPEDWAGAFRRGARTLLRTWQEADLDQPVPMPGGGEAPLRARLDHQVTELAVHTWDLARATGQDRELDPEVAERALGWSKRMLRPEVRGEGKAFGVEVPVDDDAPVYDRLAGWFGRDPAWLPSGDR